MTEPRLALNEAFPKTFAAESHGDQLPKLYLQMLVESGPDCTGLWLRADEQGEFELMVYADGKGIPI